MEGEGSEQMEALKEVGMGSVDNQCSEAADRCNSCLVLHGLGGTPSLLSRCAMETGRVGTRVLGS